MKKLKVNLRSEKGNAMLETIPLLVVFMIFVGFGLGLFGAIHSAILYSISARTYAFETFRYRTNLTYHRENLVNVKIQSMKTYGGRFHFIQSDAKGDDRIQATERPIAIGTVAKRTPSTMTDHNIKVFNLQTRNQTLSVSPIWVMVGYGMCLNAQCGG